MNISCLISSPVEVLMLMAMRVQDLEASSGAYGPRLLVEGGRLGLSLDARQPDCMTASLALARLEAVEHLPCTSPHTTSSALTEVSNMFSHRATKQDMELV